jgi:homoserine O-acetyltransferase
MIVDAIHNDPAWKGGEYTEEPQASLRTAADLLILAGSAPPRMQHDMAAPDSVDRYLDNSLRTRLAALDANDLIWQIEASRNYDPSPDLAKIRVPLVHVNFGDDFINPPDLGIAEREIQNVHGGRFVLVPGTAETHGHGTHTWAAFWQGELGKLLRATEPRAGSPR